MEKNLFAGLRRKLGTISAAFAVTRRREQLVEVHCGSCVKTGLPANSIDLRVHRPALPAATFPTRK